MRDEPYRAQGGRLLPDDTDAPRLPNPDFETLPAGGDTFPGWDYQDAPGAATFVDRAVRHGGRASLRMEDLGRTNAPSGNGRVYKRLAVKPFRHLHLRVWVKTEGFQGGEVRALVPVSYTHLDVYKRQAWRGRWRSSMPHRRRRNCRAAPCCWSAIWPRTT